MEMKTFKLVLDKNWFAKTITSYRVVSKPVIEKDIEGNIISVEYQIEEI